MTKLLRQAVQAAGVFPAEAQDDIARLVLRLAGSDDDAAPLALSPDDARAIAHSQGATARGEFASDEQVLAVWRKHGL